MSKTIILGTLKGVMRYDKELIEVLPGAKVKLVLKNTDDMPHNLLICKPGDTVAMQVAALSLALGEQAPAKNYVPESELVLHATGLVNPQQADTLYFTAPAQEGDYPYVCTFPGHAATMKGVMRVSQTGAAGLTHLTYRYYEGQWNKLPAFSALPPVDSALIADNVIDIGLSKKKDHFGFVFTGKLNVPADGGYTFFLNSDDGSRLIINGQAVVDHDGAHPAGPSIAGRVDLKAGSHAMEVQYFEIGGDELLEVSWEGPNLSRRYLSKTPAKIAADAIEREKNYLYVGQEPRAIRCSMPQSSPRSIAVGLPGGMNYCFDAEVCFVRYGWFGGFLDAGPDRGNGTGRGGQPNRPLGEVFKVGAEAFPLGLASQPSQPTPVFTGYGSTPQGPVFSYQWGPHTVKQSVVAAPGGLGLVYGFELTPAPTTPVVFNVKAEGLTVSSTAGTWNAGTLTVPPSEAGKFSVTVTVKK